jgi:hypothetical protein
MLHLSGFDDRTRAEFDRMHRTEDRILTRLGIGAVFRPRALNDNRSKTRRRPRARARRRTREGRRS